MREQMKHGKTAAGPSAMLVITAAVSLAMLFVSVTAPATAAFSGSGSGTSGDPYVITNVNQLQEMQNNLTAHYVLGNDIDASATTSWNGGAGFEPIGTYANRFTGSFDGRGHKISNLYINNRPITSYVGLFGWVGSEGAMENVGLENENVSGGYEVGGLVGINDGTVTNCYSTVTVSGSGTVGGLVGYNGGTISNCYSTSTVSGGSYVGGLVGLNFGTVSNSYSTSSVTSYSAGPVTGSGNDTGGLVGINESGGTINNSYSTGTVSGNEAVGGLIGHNEGTVSNCYSTGLVSGGSEVGGLVGYDLSNGRVSNCYSTGSVIGDWEVGGLVGWNYGIVSNCYSTGTVSGNTYVGGLIGRVYSGTVSKSFWDNQTSGQSTSAGGTGKTTAEMKNVITFIGAGWDFVNIWDIFSAVNDGYPFLTAFMEALPRTATALVISPSIFTLYPGENKTFIATLRVENNALANKTIIWNATAGNLSTSSGTTNASGWTSVSYTAPQVTSQTAVTVSAYFICDSQYQASYNSSYGTILPQTVKQSTSLSIFPPYFTLFPGYSGQVQSLIATLRGSNNNPIPNKTITCSATSGSINPSSNTTDALGQFSAVYTAPTVTAGTSVTITMSFAGDNQYGPSSATSSGIPATQVSENISASPGGTVVINVIGTNVTINVLAVPPNSLNENTSITVLQMPPENVADHVMLSNVFDIGPNGTNFTNPVTLTLPYQLQSGVSEDSLAIYYYNTDTNSWERVGGIVNKVDKTVSVQINHLSEYAVMASISEGGVGGGGLPLLTIGIIIAVVSIIAVIAFLIRRR